MTDRRHFLTGAAALALSACVRKTGNGDLCHNPANSDDLIWGVNGHPWTAYPGIDVDDQIALACALGFRSYRVNLRPDSFIWQLERLIDLGRPRGVEPLAFMPRIGDLENDPVEALYEQCFEFARDTASHFRGKVSVWELENELEAFAIILPCEMRDDGTQYPCEWGPAGGVEPIEYFGPRWKRVSAVLKGLSDGCHEGDPQARRAIGTAGWGRVGAFDRMVEDNIGWEISVWHDYETISRRFLDKLASFGRPIWITEFNAGGGGEASEADNARMLVERMAYYRRLRKSHRLEAAHIYQLLDEPYWGDTFEARMGIVRMEQTPGDSFRIGEKKPAADAVRDTIRMGAPG